MRDALDDSPSRAQDLDGNVLPFIFLGAAVHEDGREERPVRIFRPVGAEPRQHAFNLLDGNCPVPFRVLAQETAVSIGPLAYGRKGNAFRLSISSSDSDEIFAYWASEHQPP